MHSSVAIPTAHAPSRQDLGHEWKTVTLLLKETAPAKVRA